MSLLTNFTVQDELFMRMALDQARLAGRMGEVPVGAVIVRNERPLVLAHNLREASQDPLGHAELVIFGARDERAGCCGSIYRIPEDPALPGFCPCDGGLLEAECAQIMSEFFRGRLGSAPKTVGSGDEKDFERTGGRLK